MSRSIFSIVLGVVLFTAALSACGSGGSGGSTAMVKFTAIPASADRITEASFASNILGKTVDFVFGNEAVAGGDCSSADSALFFVEIKGGKIHFLEAIAIVDEVDFENDDDLSGRGSGPEVGPFAIDLLGTDDDIPNTVVVTVLPEGGPFDELKFKVKRYEDDADQQPINVTDLAALKTKIGFDANRRARPSVWMKLVIEVDGEDGGCTEAQFLTDNRWEKRIPFTAGDPTAVDTTVEFNLGDAFKDVFDVDDDDAPDASDLVLEVGFASSDKPLSSGFLDGRTKDAEKFGSPFAQAITRQLELSITATSS